MKAGALAVESRTSAALAFRLFSSRGSFFRSAFLPRQCGILVPFWPRSLDFRFTDVGKAPHLILRDEAIVLRKRMTASTVFLLLVFHVVVALHVHSWTPLHTHLVEDI